MEKKKYISPEMEIFEFDAEDVIVTSKGSTYNPEEGELPIIPV